MDIVSEMKNYLVVGYGFEQGLDPLITGGNIPVQMIIDNGLTEELKAQIKVPILTPEDFKSKYGRRKTLFIILSHNPRKAFFDIHFWGLKDFRILTPEYVGIRSREYIEEKNLKLISDLKSSPEIECVLGNQITNISLPILVNKTVDSLPKILGLNGSVKIGERFIIGSGSLLNAAYRGKLEIGNSVRIGPDVKINVSYNCQVVIEDGVTIRDGAVINAYGNIVIGENTLIHRNSSLSSFGAELRLGKNITTGKNFCAVAKKRVVIDDDCMFGDEVEIRDGSHYLKADGVVIEPEDVHVGRHVWLAKRVSVLKGVTIGDNSVVGINATVTKSIPANSVAVGSPAKVIKRADEWHR